MTANTRLTVDISDVGSGDLALVGGKGANLGELTAADLPVPAAFVVTTEAYRQFIAEAGLQDRIMSTLDGVDYDNIGDLSARAGKIREMIVAADTPAAIRDAIVESFDALSAKLGEELEVSVRSSATAEDLPGMSFAGQQDTYLNISGRDALLEHVKKCWASLWTDRAISYRHKQGFRHDEVLLAVVVQEMFPSEVSGVMFTANPVTSNPNEIFINSSWGLGEAVVSGRVNPDQFVVFNKTLEIREKIINEKMIMTARREDGQGSDEVDVPRFRRNIPSLTDLQVRELGQIGLGIQDHYGFPQDIEWGYADGRFAILQSREVTAADLDFSFGIEAFQSPEALEDLDNPKWLWSRGYSDEVQTGASTPYHYSVLERRMNLLKHRLLWYTEQEEFIGYSKERFTHIPLYRWYGARAYYNLAFERERIRRFIPPFARDDQALWPFPEAEREEIRGMSFNWIRFLWTLGKLQITNPNFSLTDTPQYVKENMKKWTDYTKAEWDKVDVDKMSAKEIFDYEMHARGDSQFLQSACLPFTIYLFVLPAFLRLLCEDWLEDENQQIYSALVSGLSTKTGEENMAIWNLAKTIKAHPVLVGIVVKATDPEPAMEELKTRPEAAEFFAALEGFLKEHGHRGGAERDAYHPRYHHQPALVLNAMRPMLKLSDEHSPDKHEAGLVKRMTDMRAKCRDTLRKMPLGFLRAPFFDWVTGLTQQYYYYRDFERFYNDRDMSRPRDFLTAIAKQFVAKGYIDEIEDIFFLGREEIMDVEAGVISPRDAKNRVRGRRRVFERYSHKEPPKFLRAWQAYDEAVQIADGEGYKGIPASSGSVTGRARVCRHLSEISQIEKGDILVTVATDPGWTTVFSIIGGVVVETGGVVAHAVMISREYGIPCVANLTNACNSIPNGALITVDGSLGTVIVHEEEEDA